MIDTLIQLGLWALVGMALVSGIAIWVAIRILKKIVRWLRR